MFRASTKHNIPAGYPNGEVKLNGKGGGDKSGGSSQSPYPYRLNL